MKHQQQHFLVVIFPGQGHTNPALQLAKRLTATSARVTFSTAVSAHRRMFPSSPTSPVDDQHQPLLSYFPYSDGFDEGFNWNDGDPKQYMSQLTTVGSETVTHLVRRLAADGRNVTCIVYSIVTPWASAVARDLGLRSVILWIQPAAVFAIYYHYFHEYYDLIVGNIDDPSFSLELPSLPLLQRRDLPSFLVANSYGGIILDGIAEMFRALDADIAATGDKDTKVKVLVNSFDALEHEVLASLDQIDLLPIGPLVPKSATDGTHPSATAVAGKLTSPASTDYTKWLDTKPDGSVVYISFGSFSVLPARQREEISRALVEGGRPYLWVVRGDREGVAAGDDGVVVEWCSQVAVLSHRAVGCFVTHCGWNSTLEGLSCGVPMVGLPQWTDQTTNAKLVEAVWGVGVRAAVNGEGLLEAAELGRCLDLVMGEGERGVEIRKSADMWRKRAREAVGGGGSSDRNLVDFVEEIGLRKLNLL